MTEQIPAHYEGTHAAFIKSRIPAWLNLAHGEAIKALHQSQVRTVPDEADAALVAARARSQRSRHAAARALEGFKGIVEFAEPLLVAGLKNRFGRDVDVHRHELLHFGNVPRYSGDVSQVKLLSQQSLLQAALRNFSGTEAFTWYCALAPLGALNTPAGFLEDGSLGSRIEYRAKLSIKPEQFASLCRELDLGQAYQHHLDEIFARPDVAPALIAASRDAFIEQVQGARVKKHISASVAQMLLALAAGRDDVTLDGRTVRCSTLQLLGTDLDEVLVIGPDPEASDREQRCIAYIPGDPNHPLKEYPSRHGLTVYLRQQLYRSQYLKFFLGFVPKREQARVYSAFDVAEEDLPKGGHVWKEVPISGEPFATLHARRLHKMRGDARVLAVPTADVDHAAWLERLNHYLSLGLNVMNVAAFFVPGLGELMLAVMGAQLLGDVFHGIEAWEVGDSAEAAGYMQSLALNVAVASGLGVVGHQVVAAVKPSAWVESLEPVELPNGQPRLWQPDLAAYRQAVELPGSLTPNPQGQYVFADKTYIRLDDVLYEQYHDTHLGRWRLRHPSDAQAYQPLLEHNGQGAWRLLHERPLQWSRTRLLRRIGHSVEGLSDAELEQALQISGVHEDVLRRMHVAGEPVPPLLADTLERMRLERQVARLSGQIRRGAPIPPGLTYPVVLVVELPGWPTDGVLQVFTRATLEGSRVEYGDVQGRGPRLKVSRDDVVGGRLAERLIDQLDDTQIDSLLGEEVGRGREERVQALRERLADYVDVRRATFFDSLYKSDQVDGDALSQVLERDFPGLPQRMRRELVEHANESERQQLEEGKVPLRLAEEARAYRRQMRLNRALEGLTHSVQTPADSARLALGTLERLPGWSSTVRLELREGHIDGPLLGSTGDPSAPTRRCLVKELAGYRAYAADGQALDSPLGSGNSFVEVLLRALPDSEQRSLGYQTHEAQRLSAAIVARAASDRAAVARVLGMAADQVWFKPPMRLADGRTGYPLSGRGDPAALRINGLVARVRALYPSMSDSQASTFLDELGVVEELLPDALQQREDELANLQQALNTWVGTRDLHPVSETHAILVREADRRGVADLLEHCWRRSTPRLQAADGRDIGHRLELPAVRIGQLPTLAADFSHVGHLRMVGMDLRELPETFLNVFTGLRWLELSRNRLVEIPQAIQGRTGLTKLYLQSNRIVWSAASGERLASLVRLKILQLDDNPLAMAPDVSALTELHLLHLRDTQITTWPGGVANLGHLNRLDLRSNRIVTIPEVVLPVDAQAQAQVASVNRATALHDNPLSSDSLARLQAYRATTGIDLGLSPASLPPVRGTNRWHPVEDAAPVARWQVSDGPSEIIEGNRIWEAVSSEPGSQALMQLLSDLRNSGDFQRAYTNLKARVWQLLRAASESAELREQLFEQAAHPQTCSDGVILVFSQLEVKVLVHEALAAGADAQVEEKLLDLAQGLYRLDCVETIALNDIAARRATGGRPDEVEVRLAYRTGLSQRLELPGQPRSMNHGHLAGVSQTMLDQAAAQVIAGENAASLTASIGERDFWVEYLERRYQDQLAEINKPFLNRLIALEDDKQLMRDQDYRDRLNKITIQREKAKRQWVEQMTVEAWNRIPDQITRL